MSAQLLGRWNGNFSQVSGWWCSRKYNGFSVIWDGGFTRGLPLSKVPFVKEDTNEISTGLWTIGRSNGMKVVQAPDEFLDKLPVDTPVHGELWCDDDLQYIKKTCRLKQPIKELWESIKLMGFYIKPYETFVEREVAYSTYEFWQSFKLKSFENDSFEWVVQQKLNNKTQLNSFLEQCKEEQWEGLVFTYPKGKYRNKRTTEVLKYKPEYESEAIITGYEKGKTGRKLGKIGALNVKFIWNDEVLFIHGGKKEFVGKEFQFSVSGLTDEESDLQVCEAKFPIGSELPFKFNMVSQNGVPQHCNIYRGLGSNL